MVKILSVIRLKTSESAESNSGFWQDGGQSLISVMIGMAVMGVAMLGFTSMMNAQQKETKAVTEKLASLDLARVVTSALASIATCNAIINASNTTGSMTVDTPYHRIFLYSWCLAGRSGVPSVTIPRHRA